MEKTYIIYCHTNKINGKKYIGQTKNPVQKRWGKDGHEYTRHQSGIFKNAILKYGWDNFEHEILFTNLSKEEADQKEIEMITYFDTTNRDKGYNLTKGGQTNTLNPEQKELRKQLNYYMWQNGIFQKSVCNPVYCIELNYEFESALEAERQLGIDNSAISKVCRKQLKYAGFSPLGQPLHWIYATDISDDIIKELKNKKEILKGIAVPVECLNNNLIFNSSKEAAEYCGVSPGTIRACITKKIKTAGYLPGTNERGMWIERPDLINTKNKIPKNIWDNFNC